MTVGLNTVREYPFFVQNALQTLKFFGANAYV